MTCPRCLREVTAVAGPLLTLDTPEIRRSLSARIKAAFTLRWFDAPVEARVIVERMPVPATHECWPLYRLEGHLPVLTEIAKRRAVMLATMRSAINPKGERT